MINEDFHELVVNYWNDYISIIYLINYDIYNIHCSMGHLEILTWIKEHHLFALHNSINILPSALHRTLLFNLF